MCEKRKRSADFFAQVPSNCTDFKNRIRGRWKAKMCHRQFLHHLVWNQCTNIQVYFQSRWISFYVWLESSKESMDFLWLLVLWSSKNWRKNPKMLLERSCTIEELHWTVRSCRRKSSCAVDIRDLMSDVPR